MAEELRPVPFNVLDVTDPGRRRKTTQQSAQRRFASRERRPGEIVTVQVKQIEDVIDDAPCRIVGALQDTGQLPEAGAPVVHHIDDLSVQQDAAAGTCLRESSRVEKRSVQCRAG